MNPEILNAQELLIIQVLGLDSVLFITANPELGWAQTLSGLLGQVQRFSGLERGIQIISNNLYLHFFLLPSKGLTWLMECASTSSSILILLSSIVMVINIQCVSDPTQKHRIEKSPLYVLKL